jgi:hypothetical protein
MNTEEHDDLWRLLGKARQPEVSPFFSRNILRAIREEAQEKPGVFAAFRAHWRILAAGVAAMTVGAVMFFHPEAPQSDQSVLILAEQVSTSPDYQVISHLDELLASEESSVWLEK